MVRKTLKNTDLKELLLRSLNEILRQGKEMLKGIDDHLYQKAEDGAFSKSGSVGSHFRHCLEFIGCFLSGVGEGRVDYDRRERNVRLDTKREYAITEFQRTIRTLEEFSLLETGNSLLVRPEEIGSEDIWCESSIERELEFLRSHTVHHYALIAFKLRASGIEIPDDFGVAPSTLRFWEREIAVGL